MRELERLKGEAVYSTTLIRVAFPDGGALKWEFVRECEWHESCQPAIRRVRANKLGKRHCNVWQTQS